jgi:hypothetical protein
MPWRTATAVDRAYLKAAADEAGNTAPASMPERLSQWFNERLLGHATTNERVAEVVHGVYQLALPPTRLLSPAVILRILLMSPVPGHAEPPAHVFEA